jgi:hypothetical protein
MSIYGQTLAEAEQQGASAYHAMEAWVSRPIDAPDVPGSVLEGYANELRASRERLRALLSEHGSRDDIVAALVQNEEFHRRLGLTIRDIPEPIDEDE